MTPRPRGPLRPTSEVGTTRTRPLQNRDLSPVEGPHDPDGAQRTNTNRQVVFESTFHLGSGAPRDPIPGKDSLEGRWWGPLWTEPSLDWERKFRNRDRNPTRYSPSPLRYESRQVHLLRDRTQKDDGNPSCRPESSLRPKVGLWTPSYNFPLFF